MIGSALLAELYAYAREAAPAEACGYIVQAPHGPEVLLATNVAPDPAEGSTPDAETARAAYDLGVLAFWHSHVGADATAEPSAPDRLACRSLGLPFLIVAPGRHPPLVVLQPEPRWQALLSRAWEWGRADCYGLVRDYFAAVHALPLPDFPRPDPFPGGSDPFIDFATAAGFAALPVEIPLAPDVALAPSDVLAMRFGAPVANHLAIVLPDGAVLHHQVDALSRREGLTAAWRRRVVAVYRSRILATGRACR